jgi:hypothetical protein
MRRGQENDIDLPGHQARAGATKLVRQRDFSTRSPNYRRWVTTFSRASTKCSERTHSLRIDGAPAEHRRIEHFRRIDGLGIVQYR